MPTELLLGLSGLLAGTFGAMLGLGGGVLIVPILTLGFNVPLTTAVGTSLICVIATSTGAAAVNIRAGRADVRLGLTLAGATVIGAMIGAIAASFLSERVLAGLFAALLGYTAASMLGGLRRPKPDAAAEPAVDATASDGAGAPAYRGRRRWLALGGSIVAGNVSSLLGVGGGIATVPLLHLLMGAPLRIAVGTSNFIFGITAAAGAYAYLLRGDVDARLAAPVVLGVAAGATLGAVLSAHVHLRVLRAVFVVVLIYVAGQMALRALGA